MKNKTSLILNLIIVILEVIALFVTYKNQHRISIEYYTEDSNILALISSLIYSLYIIFNKEIPGWLQKFKYMTTVCITLTFIVVLLILAPMYNFNYTFMLTYGSMLYMHLLCPIIGIITFIYFDDMSSIDKKDIKKGTLLTLVYAVIIISLNILRLIEGPYPFLFVYKQPIYMSIIWFVIIIGFSYLIGWILHKLKSYVRIN